MAPTITAPNARATARYQHVSPYKVRQVLDLVRGLSVDDAERMLQLCEKDAADDVLKVLESAIANAEHNFQLPADELYVAIAFADEGPTRKWGQPRARGRYFRIRKRTSHITLDRRPLRRGRARAASPHRGVVGSRRGGAAAPPGRARAPVACAAEHRRARPRSRSRSRRGSRRRSDALAGEVESTEGGTSTSTSIEPKRSRSRGEPTSEADADADDDDDDEEESK